MTDTSADLTRPEPGQEPTGEPVPGLLEGDRAALEELARAGIGEGDFEDVGLPDGHWEREERRS